MKLTISMPAHRLLRALFRVFEQAPGADVLLFLLLMGLKLSLFNSDIHVRYMDMSRADYWIAAGTLCLLSGWTLLFGARLRLALLALLNVLLTLLLYADLLYFRYFQDLLSVPVLLQARQAGALGESIVTLIRPADARYAVDWLLFLPIAIYGLIGKNTRARLTTGSRRIAAPIDFSGRMIMRVSCTFMVLAVGLMFVFVPVHKAKHTWAKTLFTGNWWNVSLYNVIGLYGYHGYDAVRYYQLEHAKEPVDPGAAAAAAALFEDRAKQRGALRHDPLFGAYRGSNVIMVQAEALQPFVLRRMIDGQEVTPVLNKLLRESVSFNRFYHQAAQGRTSDADFAVQCSQQPLRSGSVFIRHARHTFHCLPAALKQEGYSTTAYHAYEGGFWNRNMMYRAMQYDQFYSKKHYTIDEPLGWSLGDTSFFKQSVKLMTGQQEPFYSFLITLSSHHPFMLPAKLHQLDMGELEGSLLDNYIQAIHYVDASLGVLIEQLQDAGLWDQTIFVLYGDHDNSLHDWIKYEKLLQRPIEGLERQIMLRSVPLLIRLPDGRFAGESREEPAGQVDLAPTLLHLLGVDSSRYAMLGQPLLTKTESLMKRWSPVVFRDGAFTDGEVFYVPSGAAASAGTAGGSGAAEPVSGCYSIADAQRLPTERCSAGLAQAEKELAASELVASRNLLKDTNIPSNARGTP